MLRYLRKSKHCKGEVRRAKGGGRKDKLRFLFPVVKDVFETMRVHGKHIDAVDLEEYLQHTLIILESHHVAEQFSSHVSWEICYGFHMVSCHPAMN